MRDYKITHKKVKGATRIIVETSEEFEQRVQREINRKAYLNLGLMFIFVITITILLN